MSPVPKSPAIHPTTRKVHGSLGPTASASQSMVLRLRPLRDDFRKNRAAAAQERSRLRLGLIHSPSGAAQCHGNLTAVLRCQQTSDREDSSSKDYNCIQPAWTTPAASHKQGLQQHPTGSSFMGTQRKRLQRHRRHAGTFTAPTLGVSTTFSITADNYSHNRL